MENSINHIIRPLHPNETVLLRDFLYEAIYIPEGIKPPSRTVLDLPELKIYIEDFGQKKDDYCLVAECNHKIIGAVWSRIMNDYGHIDNETPSLSISLYKEYRHKGIGKHLMLKMISLLTQKGYKRISLSVQKANYATNMYLKLGFKILKETEEEFIMAKEIINDKTNPSKRLTPQYKIHPLKEKDIPEMQNLFRTTVLNINIQHYTKEEVEDWASCGDDPARWKELLSHNQYIGAFDENDCLVGFSSMNKEGYLHSMFVHKDWQGKGVATQLLFEIETLAQQFNVTDITSEVSLTARPFFEKKGYKVIKSQKAKANKLKLTNFVMHKSLKKE